MSDDTIREIKAYEYLLKTAKLVHKMFTGGHNPTEKQLDDLGTAIGVLESMKICGHRSIEECDCLDPL
jgi:hypothetical protein